MTTAYGKGWFHYHSRLADECTPGVARTAHEQRDRYVATFVGDDGVTRVVEACGDSIGIEFLDAERRSFASYQFQELEPGRLFLTLITEREFFGSSAEIRSGTAYHFRPSGRVVIVFENYDTGNTWKTAAEFDPSTHWEPYPHFGDYRSLTRLKQRRSPFGH